MTPQEFIEKRLQQLKPEKLEMSFSSQDQLSEFIFKTIMSKKFRKFSVSDEYQKQVREAIDRSVSKNEPIQFVFVFGGYKLWRLDESPDVDWAELFTLMYYAKWLKPIAEVYKSGLVFDFSSDDVIVERMNNISKAETESYTNGFRELLGSLSGYLPGNMKFTLTPVGSHYTPEEFDEDLKDKISLMEKQLGGLPTLDERRKRMVEMNVRLKPGQDSDPLWREKTELMHQAYYTVSRRRPYTRDRDKVLVFSTQIGNCIPVGTTKTSVAKFWVGVGALKQKEDGYVEYVLSPSQLANSEYEWVNVSIKGLTGKNFEKIRVLK
ncbi:MAG: hypothetical protein AAB351_01215 [Patescibacteria group bacterium]